MTNMKIFQKWDTKKDFNWGLNKLSVSFKIIGTLYHEDNLGE